MTIEETYELADAILQEDWKGIREELGDLFLHLVFYACIGKEQRQFSLEEVLTGICDKLIARHPHVYGDVTVQDDQEVKRNWEQLKLREGKASLLSGVPVSLPSLVKALRLQEKAKQVGFEWETRDQVWDKVEEEIGELKESVTLQDSVKMEEELGDVLFSLVNYARFLHIDPEAALEKTNKKFRKRFMEMEQLAAAQGTSLANMTLTEMDALWNQVKKH